MNVFSSVYVLHLHHHTTTTYELASQDKTKKPLESAKNTTASLIPNALKTFLNDTESSTQQGKQILQYI